MNLYLVQSAVLLVPLVTLPYLTRTLATANLGLLLFAQAYASLATMIVQFGFDLSASRDVAKAGADRRRLDEIVTGVLSARVLLIGVSALVSAVMCAAIPLFREHPVYLLAAWALSVAQGLSPLWYFLGRERMGILTALDLSSKIAAAAAIFVFVHGRSGGILVLLIQALATAAGVGAALVVLCVKTSFPRLRLAAATRALRESLQLALYAAVTNVSLFLPPLLVGVIASPVQVGYYGVADKLQKVPMAGLWPLSQALYPRINHLLTENPARARRLIRLTATGFLAVGIVVGAGLAASAGRLVPLVFGSEFHPAISVFRVLALAIPLALLGHVLAYQVLMPIGREQVLNKITWISFGVRLVLAVPLTLSFGAVGMAWAVLAGAVVNDVALVAIVLRPSSSLPPTASLVERAAR
jgi:PST family polysaccharide transporter